MPVSRAAGCGAPLVLATRYPWPLTDPGGTDSLAPSSAIEPPCLALTGTCAGGRDDPPEHAASSPANTARASKEARNFTVHTPHTACAEPRAGVLRGKLPRCRHNTAKSAVCQYANVRLDSAKGCARNTLSAVLAQAFGQIAMRLGQYAITDRYRMRWHST